jgi:toxin FitB
VIVLDTHVVSQAMRISCDPRVWRFFEDNGAHGLAIAAVTLFEMRFGIDSLPPSAARRRLERLFERFERGSWGAVVPLEAGGAAHAAAFRAKRRTPARPVGVPDSLIAGIALRHGAALATRNVRDFEDSGLDLIDPWRGASA